jgi:hypothetical protein
MDVTPCSSAQAIDKEAIRESRFFVGVLILARMANNQRLLTSGRQIASMPRHSLVLLTDAARRSCLGRAARAKTSGHLNSEAHSMTIYS